MKVNKKSRIPKVRISLKVLKIVLSSKLNFRQLLANLKIRSSLKALKALMAAFLFVLKAKFIARSTMLIRTTRQSNTLKRRLKNPLIPRPKILMRTSKRNIPVKQVLISS